MEKVKAIFLMKGQVVKFSDMFGTHTMKINKVEYAPRKQMYISGTILTTTNKEEKWKNYQVGNEGFFFARYKTKFQVKSL